MSEVSPPKSPKTKISKLSKQKQLKNIAKDANKILKGERNCFLFDKARNYAYSIYQNHTQAEFKNLVMEYIHRLNSGLTDPLKDYEVLATCNSITNFVIEKFSADKIDYYGDAGRAKSIIVRKSNSKDKKKL